MRIAACIKWVPDPEYPIQTGADGVKIEGADLVYMASPLDLVACEAAVRIKEAAGGAVGLFTAGGEAADKGLRDGLALGADDATRVAFADDGLNGGTRVARLLAAAIAAEGAPDVVVCGVRSPDSGSGIVPAALAEHLGMALVSNVAHLEVGQGGVLEVERRLDGGRREVLQVRLPVVLGVVETLCRPRYPALLARRRADRAPIAVRTAADLGVTLRAPVLKLLALQPPRPRSARLIAPPPGMAAHERLRFILAGGPPQQRVASRLAGPAGSVVDGLLEFLRANGVAAATNGART